MVTHLIPRFIKFTPILYPELLTHSFTNSFYSNDLCKNYLRSVVIQCIFPFFFLKVGDTILNKENYTSMFMLQRESRVFGFALSNLHSSSFSSSKKIQANYKFVR